MTATEARALRAEEPYAPLRPPFMYFGAKATLAPWIVSLLPRHRIYVEPFCGSAAVLFAKRRSRVEIINDRSSEIVTFFRVLRERPKELLRLIRATPYARDEFNSAAALEGMDELETARRWWVLANQSFAHTGRGGSGWKYSPTRGTSDALSTTNRVRALQAVVERLSSVVIENGDALDVIARHSIGDAVIYCDPPYLAATRTGHIPSSGGGGVYRHEFATEADHRSLATVLRESSACVLVSGYPSELYKELFADWHCYRRTLPKRCGRGAGRLRVEEAVWSNRRLQEHLFDGGSA